MNSKFPGRYLIWAKIAGTMYEVSKVIFDTESIFLNKPIEVDESISETWYMLFAKEELVEIVLEILSFEGFSELSIESVHLEQLKESNRKLLVQTVWGEADSYFSVNNESWVAMISKDRSTNK